MPPYLHSLSWGLDRRATAACSFQGSCAAGPTAQFTKTKSGSGLGLAISKSLIELHDGQVLIDSIEGKGTTVSVKLPKQAKAQAAA